MNTYEITVAHYANPVLATRQFRLDEEGLVAAANAAAHKIVVSEVLIGVRMIKDSVKRKAA